MRTFVFAVSCVASIVLLLGGQVANAGFLNGSFESPVRATDSSASAVPDNWQKNFTNCYLNNGSGGTPDGMAAPADGNQYVELLGYGGHSYTGLWQNTGIPLQDGYTYTLSYQVNPGNLPGVQGTTLLEAADDLTTQGIDNPFGRSDFSGLTASVWTPETVSAVYTGVAGKYLATTLTISGNYCGVDAAILTVTAPEPSTVVLLASGLISLLCYAWRKRR